MDLETFISESLRQILSAIRAAQSTPDGEAVNAEAPPGTVLGSNITLTAAGMFARVDFDVAVTADSTAKGGASVKVFGLLDLGAGGEHRATHVSRISFAVPLRLPDGGKSSILSSLREERTRQEERDQRAIDSWNNNRV